MIWKTLWRMAFESSIQISRYGCSPSYQKITLQFILSQILIRQPRDDFSETDCRLFDVIVESIEFESQVRFEVWNGCDLGQCLG